jgi:hypothetical protein
MPPGSVSGRTLREHSLEMGGGRGQGCTKKHPGPWYAQPCGAHSLDAVKVVLYSQPCKWGAASRASRSDAREPQGQAPRQPQGQTQATVHPYPATSDTKAGWVSAPPPTPPPTHAVGAQDDRHGLRRVRRRAGVGARRQNTSDVKRHRPVGHAGVARGGQRGRRPCRVAGDVAAHHRHRVRARRCGEGAEVVLGGGMGLGMAFPNKRGTATEAHGQISDAKHKPT